MLQFMMQNPWRAPSWRWLRANSIVEEGGPIATPHRDGPEGYKWIRRIMRFRRAHGISGDNDVVRMRLAADVPAMFWAHWVWEQTNNPVKWAIEAHILARETDQEISHKVGCAPEIIAAYEAMFFNVREKLNYREYVLNTVMSEAVVRGLSERHYDLLWKLFGYSGGPRVLDAMIGRMVNPIWCNRIDDVPNFFQDVALNIMKSKAAIASLTVPINNSTHMNLIEAFVKYVEIERTTDTLGKAQDQILANLNAMLGGLPFGVATAAGDRERAGYNSFDDTSIELRHEELMVTAVGLSIPHGAELKRLSFPEPEPANETTQQGSGAKDTQGKRKRS